ncbi:MAG: sugar ABC transporter ATP-binding protein, partial [Chloroflexi bacterium]|nr:sugar ABC transporter ATP-binding protein [Chloroflexota bacterium]
MAEHDYLVKMSGISKSFPGVHALDNVDFDLRPGEIHCLVGENGAGKSTLMRILSGAEQPDRGTIEIGGQQYDELNPLRSHELGIATIYQETDLVMPMSVALNIFLGHEPASRIGFVNRRQLNRRARRLMSDFGLDIRPQTPVRLLSPANQQLVQIVKALSRNNRVLVLDEPSAKLAANEIEYLFTLLRRFKEQGLGIIYISHHLNEVLQIGDRVTVLRDG